MIIRQRKVIHFEIKLNCKAFGKLEGSQGLKDMGEVIMMGHHITMGQWGIMCPPKPRVHGTPGESSLTANGTGL